jgi:hypothetical protein
MRWGSWLPTSKDGLQVPAIVYGNCVNKSDPVRGPGPYAWRREKAVVTKTILMYFRLND